MAVSALQAGKRLAQRSNWKLSNLELQKILYLAHMVYLGRKCNPLIDDEFEAWDYGPVAPSLYHRAKAFGAKPVQNVFHTVPDISEDSDEAKILDETYAKLAKHSPAQLVAMTHHEDGAWARCYVPGDYGIAIPNDAIHEEYRSRTGGGC